MSDFEQFLDVMIEHMGLEDRYQAASEILRWHNTFAPTVVKQAEEYLTREEYRHDYD